MSINFNYFYDTYGYDVGKDKFNSLCIHIIKAKHKDILSYREDLCSLGILISIEECNEKITNYVLLYCISGFRYEELDQIINYTEEIVGSGINGLSNIIFCIPNVIELDHFYSFTAYADKIKQENRLNIGLMDSDSLGKLSNKYNIFDNVFTSAERMEIEKIQNKKIDKEISVSSDSNISKVRTLEIFNPPVDNFVNNTFIEKLNSTNIYEHSQCKKEYYNAEILKASIECRGIRQELRDYNNLKESIVSIWNTLYLSYRDEDNGQALLLNTYTRIEDLNNSTLDSGLSNNVIVKKGILHQLSEECRVGWVRNYKEKLLEYLRSKKNE